MTPLSATRLLLTAGAVVTLLPSCRIVNGRLDFFWIQEQFSPPVEDTIVVNAPVSGTQPVYITPANVTILTQKPGSAPAAIPAASASPVAQNQPAATPAPATTATTSPKKSFTWPWQQPAPAPTSSQRTYMVAKGDTLSGIARKHRVSLRELLQANGITPDKADTLRDGQILNIPSPSATRKTKRPRKAAASEEPQPAPTTGAEVSTPQSSTGARETAPAPQQPVITTITTPVTQPEVSTSTPAPQPAAEPTGQPAPAATASPQVYTVLKGDTMSGIAHKHGISVKDLLQANGIAPEKADTLRDGQTLNIPAPTR